MGNKTDNNIVLPQGRLAGEGRNNNMIDENRIDIKSDVSSTRTDLEKEQNQLKMNSVTLRTSGIIKHSGEDIDFTYYFDAEGNCKQNYSLLFNKSIRVVLTQSEIRKEYTKASLKYGNFDDVSVDGTKLRSLKDKLLEGTGKMPLKNNAPEDSKEENNVEGINIPQTLRGAGPFDEIDDDINEEILIKRELLKKKLLALGKISLKNSSNLNNKPNSEPTIRIPKGGLALKDLTAPIYGISRHRILRDGDGVITLVAFSGCPLKCKYCINPQSNTLESAKYNLTAKELYHKVNIDNLYYLATNGGITFGGGEPLLYADYIREFASICNERWSLNIETSLNVPLSEIKKIIPFIKEWIVDIKDVDPIVYGNYTSKTNEQVLENLRFLASSVDIEKVLIRIPRIPNYNTDENVLITQEFLSDLGFIRFDKLTYTQDVEVERNLENDGVRGKVICEVLKKIRVLIAEDMRIDFIPNTCSHKTCSSGICPACEQELVDIQTRIIEKYAIR